MWWLFLPQLQFLEILLELFVFPRRLTNREQLDSLWKKGHEMGPSKLAKTMLKTILPCALALVVAKAGKERQR